MGFVRRKSVSGSGKTCQQLQLRLFEPKAITPETEVVHQFKCFEKKAFGKHVQRFQNCDFKNCDLSWVKLEGCRVDGGTLSSCEMVLTKVTDALVKDCTLDTSTLLGCDATVINADNSVIENSSVKYSHLASGSVLVKNKVFQSVVCCGEIKECTFADCAFDKESAAKIKLSAEALAEAERAQSKITDLIGDENDK